MKLFAYRELVRMHTLVHTLVCILLEYSYILLQSIYILFRVRKDTSFSMFTLTLTPCCLLRVTSEVQKSSNKYPFCGWVH